MWTLDSLALLIHKVASSAATKVSDLVNDLGFVDTAGAAAAAPVQSVNSQTGAVTVAVPSASSATPAMDGTGAAGSSADYSRADHVHPTDTSRAAASHGHDLSDLNNDSGFVDAAGAAAAAPVQSVNGMTGTVVVKPITTWTPSSTATALQVIAYAQANPGLIFCWARYQAATYTPVNTAGTWTYTLYTNYSTDANYVIFEAENNTTGRLYRCDAFGDWHELVRAEDMYYKAGDTFSFSGPVAGLITNGTKDLCLNIPVDKSLANITTVTVSSAKGGVRVPGGGYLEGGSDSSVWAPSSTYSVAEINHTDRMVRFRFRKSSALTNATNNTPVVMFANPIVLSFS